MGCCAGCGWDFAVSAAATPGAAMAMTPCRRPAIGIDPARSWRSRNMQDALGAARQSIGQTKMMEQKNLILAIGLSLVVLFGSQFLITRLFPPTHPVATTSTTATATGNTTSTRT